MRVILTHEQADFDALASTLGAHLLDEHAIPVLPRRLNRNLRAFVTLYGPELPFVEIKDLPPDPIEAVTLVDTQSLNTLRGMSAETKVHVVDHHQLRDDLPESWTIRTVQVGACTTLFVEELHEHNGSLSTIYATMLLLGIYEDTGSLTYASTTARDVRAAAYLLELGASLQIANKYLNPPLSPAQRKVYDRLLAAAETHHIHGQKIIISRGSGEEMTEEISSVAHKLRDLLEPDALFLLVKTTEGIRLVARSTTDQIDVSKIAAYFGGGGHERAAAALVKEALPTEKESDKVLEQVYTQLLARLEADIEPPITVGQIMSRRPLLISPETPVQKAAQLMQRYGYEGYPVVRDGKVVGLLTRRAVDRAMGHKLNLTAGSLMEAGEVTVQPRDSLEHLQSVMTSSGWGQVPVIHPKTNEIIGIVTRTDLLKTLTGERVVPGRQNLAGRLEQALPPARLALLKTVASEAHAARMPLYIVGGFVRDLLLERPSLDFDVVVEGDAIALARLLVQKFGGRVVSHSRFGTAKWWIADIRPQLIQQLGETGSMPADLPESLDLITSRTEFYDYPSALPSVERSSIKLDLHRRDFTINTMALRLDGRHYGELYDYWGGYNDLKRGLVRVLHSLSFVDDPTRTLRAVRFEQRFGFRIEERTLELIEEAYPLARQVSGARLRHELDLILAEKNAAAMLARLENLGLLRAIHPDLTWNEKYSGALQAVLSEEPPGPEWQISEELGNIPARRALAYLVWLLPLPLPSLRSISERLRFSHKLHAALIAGAQLLQDLPGLVGVRPSQVTARLESVPRAALYALYHLAGSRPEKDLFLQYIQKWQHVQPIIDGRALRKMDLRPGPIYSAILTRLRAAWLDGEIASEVEEKELLERLLQSDLIPPQAVSE